MEDQDKTPIALHVLVVGFHHKKGMQVEYAYPPLNCDGELGELPEKWKHLPSLCLPDGAHNHEADTIYFHLPHLTKDSQTVFGVSCYRQIDAEKVANKTADITRNTVQKSVCVLTTMPIYGYVQERLKVTTKVYFKGADFSDVRDLEGLYHDLNNTNWRDRLMHGICVSEAVRIFGRNILVLFKLLLLERRVLFYSSPVAPLVKVITSLLALLPANLPQGLAQAAATRCRGFPSSSASSDWPRSSPRSRLHETCREEPSTAPGRRNECDATTSAPENGPLTDPLDVNPPLETTFQLSPINTLNEVKEELSKIINITPEDDVLDPTSTDAAPSQSEQLSIEGIASESDDVSDRHSSNSSLTSVTSRASIMSPPNSLQGGSPWEPSPNFTAKISSLKGRLSGALTYWTGRDKSAPASEKPSSTTTPNPSPSEPGEDVPLSPSSGVPLPIGEVPPDAQGAFPAPQSLNTEKYATLEPLECGLPLQIFTKGNLLHPYLSLQYLDVLTAPSTRAFVVGASNTLFIHKRNFYEVLVQLEDGKIEMADPELRRQLALSIEDLRFAENLVRQVEAVNTSVGRSCSSEDGPPPADVFLEGVGWMGGEEWLRHQFKIYLLTLLRASLCPDLSREMEVFNGSFMAAWKETHNYRMWVAGGPYPALSELPPGHPHAGHLSMTDMRIRLSQTIQSLDRGRRLNQTLASTGTAVVKTKEAVGGALTSAKGALSTLWTSFTATSGRGLDENNLEDAIEATEQLTHTKDPPQQLPLGSPQAADTEPTSEPSSPRIPPKNLGPPIEGIHLKNLE